MVSVTGEPGTFQADAEQRARLLQRVRPAAFMSSEMEMTSPVVLFVVIRCRQRRAWTARASRNAVDR